jgi:hypothetical protein
LLIYFFDYFILKVLFVHIKMFRKSRENQQMKRTKMAKRIICLIIAFAMTFVLLPSNAVGAIVRAVNSPWFMEGLHEFDLPQQGIINFTSKPFDIRNPIFADGNVAEFSSNNASGWEAATASNAVTGVLNTSAFDPFKGRQEIANLSFMTENPHSSSSSSPNVLVLANKTAAGTASANFSQNLDEFWADGYFQVEVDFYAVGTQSAVYLIPEQEFEHGRPLPRVDVNQASIRDGSAPNPNITILENLSAWQTATFIVKTDLLEGATFKLGLYLGKHGGQASGGVVYYDNVRVRGFSKAQFENNFDRPVGETFANAWRLAKEQSELGLGKYRHTSIVDLSQPVFPNPTEIAPYSATKTIFENFDTSAAKFEYAEDWFETPDNTNILPHVKLEDIPSKLNIKKPNTQVFGVTNPDNAGAMLLTAVDASVGLRYNEPIKWNRNEIYMINFYAITSDESIGYFRMRDTRYGALDVPNHIRPNLYNSGFIAIKNTETSSAPSKNNWILNTVFVIGEALEDIQTHFEFWVGGEFNTTGYLMVDDFRVSRVSGAFYEKYKNSTNVTQCNLDWLSPTSTIENANFNSGIKRSNISAFPLVATGWEVSVEGDIIGNHLEERRILNGIVNTDEEHWRANNIIIAEDPNRPLDGNRAYGSAIRPINPIISGNFAQSLNNNIYMMQNVRETYQTVSSNSFTLASDTRNVIAFDAATARLSNREVWAIIEVSGREITRLPLVRETGDFSDLSDWRNYTIVVQTSKFTSPEARITFALGTKNAQSTGCLYLNNVRVHQSSPATGDITVDLNDPSKLYLRDRSTTAGFGGESLFFIPADEQKASAFFNAPADVLAISTTGCQHATVSNHMIEQLEEEKPYEYIVRILPNAHVSTDISYDTDANHDWGLSLRIKNGTESRMDGGFLNLKSDDFRAMPQVNGLIELRFLIKSGTPLELSLEIEFGNENVIAQGAIGIKGLELREYSDDMFRAAQEDPLTRIITTSTMINDDEAREKGKGPNLDFLMWPSLITGAAIIFAVVAFSTRKFKFRRHIRQNHTSYARDDMETNISKKDLKAPKAKKAPKIITEEDTRWE